MRKPLSRRLVVIAIIASMTVFPGCKLLKKKPPPPSPTPVQQYMAFSAGDRVDVRWNGSWWRAIILTVHAPFYRVHYIGWTTTWDEDVLSDRVRFLTSESREGTETAPPPPPVVARGWKAGDRVDVSWNGQWWAAQVLYPSGSGYRVHYTGWSSSWDETVSAGRVRNATSGARRGTN